jgi:hypothetical protein
MSPIKGLTDRNLAFPEIGQVRKGAKKTVDANGRTTAIGKDLQYFRVDFDEREVEAIKKFTEIYHEKPTMLNILLPFNEIDRCWDAYLEAYTAGRLVARSDGERFLYKVNTKTGEVEVVNGQPDLLYDPNVAVGTYTSKDKEVGIYCRPVGRLRVVIPELKRLAYLTVLTTSKHDIMNISSQLAAIAQMTNGKISGIPLILKRTPHEISTPMPDGKRARREKWLLSIEASPEWVERQITSMQLLSYPAIDSMPLAELPTGAIKNVDYAPDGDEDDDSDIPSNFGNEEGEPVDGRFVEADQDKLPLEQKQPDPVIYTSKAYWALVTAKGMTPLDGQEALTKAGNDYDAAAHEINKIKP